MLLDEVFMHDAKYPGVLYCTVLGSSWRTPAGLSGGTTVHSKWHSTKITGL